MATLSAGADHAALGERATPTTSAAKSAAASAAKNAAANGARLSLALGAGGLASQPIPLDLPVEIAAIHAEPPRRLRHVPLALLERR